MEIYRKYVWLFMLAVTGTSCLKSDYKKMVERELATGLRYDSLFLGVSFGMMQKDFYNHCWQLNKDSVIKQGPQNLSVQFTLEDLKYDATFNFYPNFYDNKIYEMPVKISYIAWAPWNRQLWSDSLQLDVVNMMEKWYGGEFLKVEHPKKGVVYVKVDGNRRINIGRLDDQIVKITYTDLTVDEQVKSKEVQNEEE